jgi:hypothetical protein
VGLDARAYWVPTQYYSSPLQYPLHKTISRRLLLGNHLTLCVALGLSESSSGPTSPLLRLREQHCGLMAERRAVLYSGGAAAIGIVYKAATGIALVHQLAESEPIGSYLEREANIQVAHGQRLEPGSNDEGALVV